MHAGTRGRTFGRADQQTNNGRKKLIGILAAGAAVLLLVFAFSGGSGGAFDDEHYVPEDFGELNPPHGGQLVELMATPERSRELITSVSTNLMSYTLTHRQLCDLEMLLYGAFSPLTGFMDQATYNSVVDNMRLPNNLLWPMPITLDLTDDVAEQVQVGTQMALRDEYHNLIAILTVSDKWQPDKAHEAEMVFRATDQAHPAVDYLFNKAGNTYVGGLVEGVELPKHFDFNELRYTPKQARAAFDQLGWRRIVAFQTRNPMHRAHIELTKLASRQIKGHPFINPIVGMTKPGDVDYSVRVRCYKAIVESGRYYEHGAFLGVLPLAMRMAGPREALWHSLIRKNYGATHFIVGRDHAGCKKANGDDFYGPYDAQDLVASVKDEIGIEIVPFKKLVYLPDIDKYLPADTVADDVETKSISGTKFRAMMAAGEDIPPWFSDPDVIKILSDVNPPLRRRGFTVFFTGLSGSGKTTISMGLIQKLTEINPARKLTVLDGDVVRTHLSKGLGFTIDDRNTNVARIGWVAGEVTRHGGLGITVAISPFEQSREEARTMVTAAGGGFLEVYVSTSVEECARRDVKGLYKKAAEGQIELTGVSHPFEMPEHPELMIDAEVVPVEDSVDYIIGWLAQKGYIERQGNEELSADKLEKDSDMVLTEGIKDPAARMCKRGQGNDITLGLGPYGSGLHMVRLVTMRGTSTTLPANVYTIDQLDFESAEAKAKAGAGAARVLLDEEGVVVGEEKVAQHAFDLAAEEAEAAEGAADEARELTDLDAELADMVGDLVEADRDVEFATGTPAANPLTEAQRVEVAWSLYYRVKNTELKENVGGRVATSPRLAAYARHMLRFDPCVRVIAVAPERAVAPVEGASAEDAARYASEYSAAVSTLVEEFPERVMTTTASALGTDAATRATVRQFAGL